MPQVQCRVPERAGEGGGVGQQLCDLERVMAQLKLANGYANSRLDVLRDIRYAWIDCSVKRVG